MAANLDELKRFAVRGYAIELARVDAAMKDFLTDRSAVRKDQVDKRPPAVSCHRRKTLLGNRKNLPPGASGIAVIENAKLVPWCVFLHDEVTGRRKTLLQLVVSPDDPDAGSALPLIRLQHDRKLQAGRMHELLNRTQPHGRRQHRG